MNIDSEAQAAILLTVRLGKSDASEAMPLNTKEWNSLANWLKGHNNHPSDLLDPKFRRHLPNCEGLPNSYRLEFLLGRGVALAMALEKWERAGIWVLFQSAEEFPERLRDRLKQNCPPVLFGSGNHGLLSKGGIAVVGSRNARQADLDFAKRLARTAAGEGHSVISGCARGVDRTAMFGALDSEGTVVGVLADGLLRAAISAAHRKHLLAGDLVLVSPFSPEAAFNVGNLMRRNRYIYCLADAAVAVSSTVGKGGTWSGATENLKSDWVPLWVARGIDSRSGNSDLVRLGAKWFPEGATPISDMISGASTGPSKVVAGSVSSSRPAEVTKGPSKPGNGSSEAASPNFGSPVGEPSSELPPDQHSLLSRSSVSSKLYELFLEEFGKISIGQPLSSKETAEKLGLTPNQAREWLKCGEIGDRIKKFNRPVRYQATEHTVKQDPLFD